MAHCVELTCRTLPSVPSESVTAFICRITLQAYITFALNWRDVCAKMKKRGLDETRTECLSV